MLYLVAVEDGRLVRVKPRSASFHNLAAFHAAFPKDILTDFAFIEASFGFSIAGSGGLMPWIPRGLREGIVTSRYPRRPDGYGDGFSGTVLVRAGHGLTRPQSMKPSPRAQLRPSLASMGGSASTEDAASCVGDAPRSIPPPSRSMRASKSPRLIVQTLVVPESDENDEALATARRELHQRVRALRRSIHVRHVDAGSDGSEEWEVAALTNPIYDVQRLGIYFTASPKHADVLLVTGAGAAGMLDALRQTYEVMPEPKIVIAAGTDAISGGLVGVGYATAGGIADTVPVDVFVPGSPPTPFGLLHGILTGGRPPRRSAHDHRGSQGR